MPETLGGCRPLFRGNIITAPVCPHVLGPYARCFGQADDDSTSVPFTPMVQQHLLKKGDRDVKPKDACDTSFSKGDNPPPLPVPIQRDTVGNRWRCDEALN